MDNEPSKLGKIFYKYLEFEFDKEDVEATITTMTEDPYVHHIPTLTGRRGYNGVYNFYKNHLIGKMPKDVMNIYTGIKSQFSSDRSSQPENIPITGAEQTKKLVEISKKNQQKQAWDI